MPLDNVVFWVFAPISVASAVAMLTRRNAVHAALFLVVNFFTIAVMYLLLDAPFLFAVQIIVYAGAIMVLFLFVIMLLGVDRDGATAASGCSGSARWRSILGVGFVAGDLLRAARRDRVRHARARRASSTVNAGGEHAGAREGAVHARTSSRSRSPRCC